INRTVLASSLPCHNCEVARDYWDMSMRKSVDSWRDIRRLRASPPGAAKTTGARVDTFRAALEQSEQQLRAAANVDYDSRSLNLFYGLSQAGRALAAAATTLNVDELDWRLDGHGL